MDLWLLVFPVFLVLTFSVYKVRQRFVYIRGLQASYRQVLQEQCRYYQQLNSRQKQRFERRVRHFVYSKAFIPRNFKQVTFEMKALIAASAVQLTFGLPANRLRYFRKIIIYPDVYFSVINRKYHKGEVNPSARVIVISWKNFKEGLSSSSDSLNLGLHEMAHALWLANKYANHVVLEDKWVKKWIAQAWLEMKNIREGKLSIFRKYGGRNEDEFFAVTVEHFFENPEEFRQQEPKLYQVFCRLLRQDPALLNNWTLEG